DVLHELFVLGCAHEAYLLDLSSRRCEAWEGEETRFHGPSPASNGLSVAGEIRRNGSSSRRRASSPRRRSLCPFSVPRRARDGLAMPGGLPPTQTAGPRACVRPPR